MSDLTASDESPSVLRLFLIARDSEISYDQAAAYVVAAEDAAAARQLVARRHWEEDQDDAAGWIFDATVGLLGIADEEIRPGIVLRDFRAG